MLSAKKFAVLLVIFLVVEQFSAIDAWRRRRRRRRFNPPPVCRTPTKPSAYYWNSNWGKSFTVHCANAGYSISHIRGLYSSCHKDRVWSFACARNAATKATCSWTKYYVNGWKATMRFNCPSNGFITGIHSIYNKSYGDRKYKFKCCHRPGYIRRSCFITSNVNTARSWLNYQLPYKRYLAGVSSRYYNGDRLWRFTYCRAIVKRCHWYWV